MTVHWLALALADCGHSVAVLSVARRPEPCRYAGHSGDARDLGYPLIRLPEPAAVTSELLGELAPDVALVNGFEDGLADWARRLRRVLAPLPAALYLHDARGVPLAADFERVAAVSRFVAGLCAAGAEAIPPIVDRARYRVATSRERVLFVNPVPEKGLDTAIELARARPDVPFAFQLGWWLPARFAATLRERVAPLANVELREPSPDPGAIYRDARLLIAPSVAAEAWGRVAREAQASGVPVLAARVGGLPEAVGSGGVVVGPEAGTSGWLAALGRLWDDGDTYAVAAARAGRQAAEPATGSDAVASAFEDLLAGIAMRA
jgi:glycosyltransferase involved in cell wall biosynthesis